MGLLEDERRLKEGHAPDLGKGPARLTRQG